MRTIKEWNKIIENYFNENNIEHDRNYLCFFPEKKMRFDKKLIYDVNEDLRESIIVLFKKDNIEIFSCDVTLKISSGIQLSNIGKIRKIVPWEKVMSVHSQRSSRWAPSKMGVANLTPSFLPA